MTGRIIVGIDGTTLHVPRSRSTIRAYTLINDILGTALSHYPQAMLISAWDVVKRVPITWELTSLKVGERRGLLRMLLRLPENAVLALDRGYPGRDVLGEIVASGRDCVVRIVCWFAVTAVIAQAAEGDTVAPDGSYRRVNTRRVFDAIS